MRWRVLQVDVFAFAMFIYEMLTGEFPFAFEYPAGLTVAINKDIQEGVRPKLPVSTQCD